MSTRDQFDTFAEDLLGERAPRPLIIIGSSKVDDLLLQILTQHLLPKRTKLKDQDELLEGDRPLATFSARIKLTYRLGLIDDTLCVALEQLRNLRNQSAHSVAFDIVKSPAREHLTTLRKSIIYRQSYHLTRDRYFDDAHLTRIEELQCLLLTLCVLLEAIRMKISRTRVSKQSIKIASG